FFLLLLAPLYSVIRVTHFSLPNGLTILLSPDETMNSVCVLTYHKNGTTSDPADIRGASYLYQKLMFLETENLSPYERVRFIMKNGGRSSGKINYDNSVFYQVVPSSDLNYALWLESERLQKLKLTDLAIIGQRKEVYDRIYRFINRSIHFRSGEWIRKELFKDSIYKTPLYGDIEKLNTFDTARIKRIYQNFSNPKNIILVISGKFEEDKIREKIDRYFGSFEAKSIPVKDPVAAGRSVGYKYENWMREVIPKSFILIGLRAPSKLNLDYTYFKLLVYYLVDKRISKLNRIFKSNLKMDVDISYDYSDNIGANSLLIKITSAKRAELERVRFSIRRLFDMLMTDRLTSSELKTIKSLMEIDFLKNLTKPEKMSLILAENYHMSGNIDYGNMFLKRVRKINSFDIVRISKKYLKKENMVILNVFSK
ncbi:MAG: insulinase family protein, partial [Candidatus Aminicenantes bacterium]|nr:insulinase family protein [Candidatus Aminicenantes bacterium]